MNSCFYPRHRPASFASKASSSGWILVVLSLILVGVFPASLRSAESWVALGVMQGATPASLHGIKDVAACGDNVIALKEDGSVVSWGYASQGANVPPWLTDVISISTNNSEFFAVQGDGTLWGWGLGTLGTSKPQDLPPVTKCVAGYYHALCLTRAGTVIAWGDNSEGQIDVPADLQDVVDIAAGGYFSVALKRDGTVVTWGTSQGSENVAPADLSGVIAIAADGNSALALRNDGTVVMWGDEYILASFPVPEGLSGVVKIAICDNRFMALKNDGTVVRWGQFFQDIPGDSDVVNIAQGSNAAQILHADGSLSEVGFNSYNIFLPPTGIANVKEIIPAMGYSIAVRKDGTVFGWGSNFTGELNLPEDLLNPLSIAAGYYGGYAVSGAGALLSWGNFSSIKPPVAAESGVVSIKKGWYHALALKADGSVLEWNIYGQAMETPVLTDVVAIDADSKHSIALKRDGTVVSWGDSVFGEPVIVPEGLADVVAVAAGGVSFFALKRDGTVLKWGSGATDVRGVDLGLNDIVDIKGFSYGIVALKSDQTVISTYYSYFNGPNNLAGVTRIVAGNTDAWALASSMPDNEVIIYDANVIYDGNPHGLAITTANRRTPTRTTYNGLYPRPVEPGVYEVIAEADYLDSYGRAVGRLIIRDPLALSQTIFWNEIGDIRYGSAPVALQATSTSGLPVSVRVVSGPAIIRDGLLVVTGVGAVVVAADQIGNAHFWEAPTVQRSLTVLPAILNIAGANASRQVGVPNPGFIGTINGVVDGDGISAVFMSAASASTPIGMYGPTSPEAITPAIIDLQGRLGNYTVIATNGTLTITAEPQSISIPALGNLHYGDGPLLLQATATSGLPLQFHVVSGPASIADNFLTSSGVGVVTIAADQIGDAHFAAAHAEQTVTVLPALLSIVATDATRMVGAPNPPFTGVLTGVVNGDNITGSYSSSATDATAPGVFGPDTPEAIAPVIIDPQGKLVNYTVQVTKGTLTISTEIQSIAFVSLGSPRYGEGHLFLQATATSGLPVQFRVVSGPASIAGNVMSLSGAGTVTIAADQAGDAHFAAAHAEQTITVLPALLSIVATDTTRMVGAPNPSFAGVLTGVVSGDGITGAYASTATDATPPGVFGPEAPEAIVPTLRDPNHRLANYAVTVTRGTLTILAPATDFTTPANGGGGGCSAGGAAAVLLGAFGLMAWRRRGNREV